MEIRYPLHHRGSGGGFIDELLIREQWDPMARVAVSLRDQTAPAHVILRRLASSPKDRLSKAITALGRLLKTTYILQYLHDDTLREREHRQLNRGESPERNLPISGPAASLRVNFHTVAAQAP